MLEALDLGHVRVPVDDRLAVRESSGEPRLAAKPRAGVVNHPDLNVRHLDDSLLRQSDLQSLLVHVPVHAFDWRPDGTQLFEEGSRYEVSAV